MTHDEALELLAGYAIDALDADEAELVAEHVDLCTDCQKELESLLQAVDALADAVPALAPPERLRARVLLDRPVATSRPAPSSLVRPAAPAVPPPMNPSEAPEPVVTLRPRFAVVWQRAASLVAVVAVVALSATSLSSMAANRGMQDELVHNRAALDLLSSTETSNNRLERSSDALPADAHGHWFHKSGVRTQVIVGELLPPLRSGEHYVVWELRGDRWNSLGDLPVDATGYGRLVALGDDGSGVQGIQITLEARQTAMPGPNVMLAWRASPS